MSAAEQLPVFHRPQMPDFSDPLALLVHCHERIDGHLRALERSADALRAGMSGAALDAAFAAVDAACGHFALQGVKHTEDEEVSLFPRLRERGGEGVAEALAAADELELQHRSAERLHAELDALVARLPRDGSARGAEVDRFGGLVALLAALYRPHIRVENELIFPAAARVLPAEEILALGEEMRARRRLLLQRLHPTR